MHIYILPHVCSATVRCFHSWVVIRLQCAMSTSQHILHITHKKISPPYPGTHSTTISISVSNCTQEIDHLPTNASLSTNQHYLRRSRESNSAMEKRKSRNRVGSQWQSCMRACSPEPAASSPWSLPFAPTAASSSPIPHWVWAPERRGRMDTKRKEWLGVGDNTFVSKASRFCHERSPKKPSPKYFGYVSKLTWITSWFIQVHTKQKSTK